MTVPAGTSGTPAVGTVTPSAIAGGTVSLSGTTLSYTFAPASVSAGTVLSIQVTGLTNTTSAGGQTSVITTEDGATAVDAGSADFTFTGTALTGVNWTASSTMVGAANTSYSYTFTPSSTQGATVTTITMSVPPGTSGTPVSIQVNGLTNTSTAGQYVPEIVTGNPLGPVDSGVATAVTFPGALTLAAPASLSWSGTLNGANQALPDTDAVAELFMVNDQTGSDAGWHVTVSATSFTNGSFRCVRPVSPAWRGKRESVARKEGTVPMRGRASRTLAAVAVAAAAAAGPAGQAAAASPLTGQFTVAPPPDADGQPRAYFQLSAAPGGSVTDVVVFGNGGQATQRLRVGVTEGITAANSGSAYGALAGGCAGPACWVTS